MTQESPISPTLVLPVMLEQAAALIREFGDHPYGPEITPEMNGDAGEACIRLCDGDRDKARTLWKLIVADLGGYMPRGVVLALMRASNTSNILRDIEPPDLDGPR